MNIRRFAALAAFLATGAFASDSPHTYADAKALWEQSKARPEYSGYATEFAQFSNHFHLDEKDGCYQRGTGPVNLMLVIVHRDGDEFAVVDSVLSDVDNAKSQCFAGSYRGLRTKVPPFLPFVLQMRMG